MRVKERIINSNVLLDAMCVIGIQIADVINDSLQMGVFPNALKKSTIIPVQKKSGTVLINEYRPINMLPCLEKLIEKLVHSQLISYITKHKLLFEYQSGFREKHSCETAINDVLYEWKDALNGSKSVIAVFLDFQRAFETIDPKLLISKLNKFGITDVEIEWFRSYLSDRRQVVKIGNVISNELNNRLGVPQGSILGPLVFICYINDLEKCLKYCQLKMFADDTLIYIISDNISIATQQINSDLSVLFNKLCQNKLKLNKDKTKVVIVTNKNINKDDVNIYIDGSKLQIENEIKYLGVILDSKLQFDENTDYLCKKLGMKMSVMSRLRHELNTEQKAMLYRSLIEPHFTYCASILYLAKQSDIDRLQIIQNKCMRNILRVDKYTNSQFMLNALNILSVNQLIIFRTLIFIFKIVHNLVPNYLSNKITYRNETNERILRNGNQINLIAAHKSCSQNALFFKGIKLYNSLPVNLRAENSQTKFEKYLRNYVKENFE